MKFKQYLKIHFFLFLLFSTFSCEKYEDYITDFDYSAVYFGSQKPLRTVVSRENKETIDFKIGVVLAGLRENNGNHWAKFKIDPSLLESVAGASGFTVLPEDYYTTSLLGDENKITIPKGKFLGDFVLSLNKDKFTSDPLSITKNYALPLRLTETSADSILTGNEVTAGKDYTIIVIKYIKEESGTYYVRGSQVVLDDNGAILEDTRETYSHMDLIKNKTRVLTTFNNNSLIMNGTGAFVGVKNKLKIELKDDLVALSSESSSSVNVEDLGSLYNKKSKIFNLKYSFIDNNLKFLVEEELTIRQDPELDLRYEEW